MAMKLHCDACGAIEGSEQPGRVNITGNPLIATYPVDVMANPSAGIKISYEPVKEPLVVYSNILLNGWRFDLCFTCLTEVELVLHKEIVSKEQVKGQVTTGHEFPTR